MKLYPFFKNLFKRTMSHLPNNRFSRLNDEIVTPFQENARIEHQDDRKRLCAHTLFESFTAGIIKENTSFTR